jgi:TetR/AcrR family fatty acid metabolism transcriptional regulator
LGDIIEKGKAKKEITDALSSAEIMDLLLSTARGLAYTWCLHDGQYPLQESLHRSMTYIVRALVN